jgi:AcrR family transcriptional regulator
LSSQAPEQRQLRSDARRNRERVLLAARESFAEYGLEAQMDDVARRAGVGVGTVYRHFPTKDALVDALVAERWRTMTDAAAAALDADDAWRGLSDWLWHCARLQCGNRAWAQLAGSAPGPGPGDAERLELLEATARVVERAKRAGAVRDDLTAEDVGMLMCGTCSVIATTGGHEGSDQWERFFEVALDGLRPRD